MVCVLTMETGLLLCNDPTHFDTEGFKEYMVHSPAPIITWITTGRTNLLFYKKINVYRYLSRTTCSSEEDVSAVQNAADFSLQRWDACVRSRKLFQKNRMKVNTPRGPSPSRPSSTKALCRCDARLKSLPRSRYRPPLVVAFLLQVLFSFALASMFVFLIIFLGLTISPVFFILFKYLS